MEATLIPLDQLIPEFLLALGGAFLLGNLAAYIRLRSAWREAKRPGPSRVNRANGGGKSASAKSASAKSASAKSASSRAAILPSRTRVLTNVVVGLVVTVASLAALIARG